MHALPLVVTITDPQIPDRHTIGDHIYQLYELNPQIPLPSTIILPIISYQYFQDYHQLRSKRQIDQAQKYEFPPEIVSLLLKHLLKCTDDTYRFIAYSIDPLTSNSLPIVKKLAWGESDLVDNIREIYLYTHLQQSFPVAISIQPLIKTQISGIAQVYPNTLENPHIFIMAAPGIIENLHDKRFMPHKYTVDLQAMQITQHTKHTFDRYREYQKGKMTQHLFTREFAISQEILQNIASVTHLASKIIQKSAQLTWSLYEQELSILDIEALSIEDHLRAQLATPQYIRKLV